MPLVKLTNKYVYDKQVKTRLHEKTMEIRHFNRKDNKVISIPFFRKICEKLYEKYGVHNVAIRAMTHTGFFTFKGFSDDDVDILDYDEYFVNKVRDPSKFKEIIQIEATILKD